MARMNPAALVQTLTTPRRAEASMYPTAYAIDFVIENRRAFARHSGVAVGASYSIPSLRQACWDAIGAYARAQGVPQAEMERTFADAHMLSANIIFVS